MTNIEQEFEKWWKDYPWPREWDYTAPVYYVAKDAFMSAIKLGAEIQRKKDVEIVESRMKTLIQSEQWDLVMNELLITKAYLERSE